MPIFKKLIIKQYQFYGGIFTAILADTPRKRAAKLAKGRGWMA